MGEIRSIKELTRSDWSDYWGAVQLVPDRSGGEYKLPGRPWHFSRDELTPIGTPAFQGEHNREVFAELGVNEEELQRLSETGVLVTHRRVLAPEVVVEKGAGGAGGLTVTPRMAPLLAKRFRQGKGMGGKRGSPAISDRESQKQ
jgi:hypothetical protein